MLISLSTSQTHSYIGYIKNNNLHTCKFLYQHHQNTNAHEWDANKSILLANFQITNLNTFVYMKFHYLCFILCKIRFTEGIPKNCAFFVSTFILNKLPTMDFSLIDPLFLESCTQTVEEKCLKVMQECLTVLNSNGRRAIFAVGNDLANLEIMGDKDLKQSLLEAIRCSSHQETPSQPTKSSQDYGKRPM